jgi:DNA-directed RNA polymerase specialized sigma24 family protein
MYSPNSAGWLMNTLKNHLRKHYVHLAANKEVSNELRPEFDEAVVMAELDGAFSFASVLSPDELQIVKLKEQGYKHREIAEITGSNKGTIDSKFSRIKDKLTRFLETE